MTNQIVTLDIAAKVSSLASDFESLAREVMGVEDEHRVDFDATAAALAAATAREYEALMGLPDGSVEVEFVYNWPYPLEDDGADNEMLGLAYEWAWDKQGFWVEEAE